MMSTLYGQRARQTPHSVQAEALTLYLLYHRRRSINLREPMRQGATDEALRDQLLQAISAKPAGHRLAERIAPKGRLMSQTGG